MTYTAKAAVCSQIRTKHSTQSEHHVEFWILNLVVSKETARIWKFDIYLQMFTVCYIVVRKLETTTKQHNTFCKTASGLWHLIFYEYIF